jgi:hypothetical protein
MCRIAGAVRVDTTLALVVEVALISDTLTIDILPPPCLERFKTAYPRSASSACWLGLLEQLQDHIALVGGMSSAGAREARRVA